MNKWHSYASEELLAWLLEENYPSVRYDTLTDYKDNRVLQASLPYTGVLVSNCDACQLLLSAIIQRRFSRASELQELEDGGTIPQTLEVEGSRTSFMSRQFVLGYDAW
jgi:hypothetical protein